MNLSMADVVDGLVHHRRSRRALAVAAPATDNREVLAASTEPHVG